MTMTPVFVEYLRGIRRDVDNLLAVLDPQPETPKATSPPALPAPPEHNGRGRLTEAKVRTIRKALRNGKSRSELAEQYGVTPSAIANIDKRR